MVDRGRIDGQPYCITCFVGLECNAQRWLAVELPPIASDDLCIPHHRSSDERVEAVGAAVESTRE